MGLKKQSALVVVLLVLAAMAFGIKSWIGESNSAEPNASATPTAQVETDSPNDDSSVDEDTDGDQGKADDKDKKTIKPTPSPKPTTPATKAKPRLKSSSKSASRLSSSSIAHQISRQLNAKSDIPVRVECPPTFASRPGQVFNCRAFDPRADADTTRDLQVRIGQNDSFTWSSLN